MRAARTLVTPPSLAPGARVALVAPAGPLRGPEDVERGCANVRELGWEPVVGMHILERAAYFAGSDAVRLADLNAALRDPRIDGVWCLRGGYGVMRLLDGIDYDALRRRPKALLGFSDITALHAAVGVRCGLATFHAPVARNALSRFSRDSLERAVGRGIDPCGRAPDARTLRRGRVGGRLVGGNLALLAALAGTPYAPDLTDAILVVEDVGEAVYRVDRMLRQLLLSGALAGCRAIVAGAFTEVPADASAGHAAAERTDAARTTDDVVGEIAEILEVPCLAGIPVGHIDDQWTLPLGAAAELDADARRLAVQM
ncbi:MAG TPA: LD-carboxypeptidase [Gemmatimonadaceae bacterium]